MKEETGMKRHEIKHGEGETLRPRAFILCSYFVAGALALAVSACGPRGEQGAMRKGIEAYRDKNYPEAIDLLTKAAQRITGSAELYYYLGSAHLMKGELDAAYEAFNAAVDSEPSHGESIAGMGQVAFLKGELPKARGLFEQALKSTLTTPDAKAMALNGLGLTCREAKEPGLARLSFLRALKEFPSYAPTYYNFACLESDIYQQYEPAADQFNMFVHIAAKDDPYVAKAKNHLERLDQVMEQERQAHESNPPARDEAASQKALEEGIVAQSAKRLPLANKAYKAALTADPLSFNAAWGWGNVAKRQALRIEALEAFTKAAELKPGFLDAYIEAAEQAFQMRRYDEAEKLLDSVFARSPFMPAASEMMVRIRFAQKKMSEVHLYGAFYLSLLKPEAPNRTAYEKWLKTVPDK